MKTIRYCLFDILEGLRDVRALFLVELVVVLLFDVLAYAKCVLSGLSPSLLSFGSFLATGWGGTLVFNPERQLSLILPAEWMLTIALMLYIPLRYPTRDLSVSGARFAMMAGSRLAWWLSKALWVVICVLLYWVEFAIVSYVAALVVSGDVSTVVSSDIAAMFGFDSIALLDLRGVGVEIGGFVSSAAAVSCALAVSQLAISLVLKPVLSYMVHLSLLFTSVFFFTPYLPGNHLMAARGIEAIPNGLAPSEGYLFAFLIVALFLIGGAMVAQRMDFLSKEYDS